ncbi:MULTISPECIES: uroporphyrinogen-III synthase [unclassified Imperialibacter]|jgi:uroporphyrinogen-III synthase|uniref:uroporphyrinogen-III synthase n=1 Tax=unclassified Imperialibacter TaxID=2629706 RepID=UPI00125BEE88|nr:MULTISPECIES: uroporphyrinogen-III synthase [unclassified Imperialibacter]CAD5271113.1 Uroporphyrinogen-III synthase [Imperialibacter sp. 89]CAD5298627.1 Uroporphyrinogen-III synthase [Imperialibacter sp. 75]VVT34986.1 Uroporphyrinogen-III synthase [Imperialibacter sp. EC-SDR9]
MILEDKSRLKKVSSILVSQPKPSDPNSPYFKLAEQYNIKVDFRPFIKIEPTNIKEFRQQKVDILAHTAVIFTSRNAVDHFFRLAAESKIEIPADMKYFCISEQTANYLQKYIVIRKRKIFTGLRTATDLIEIIKKHKNEKYLFPCSDIRKEDIPVFLEENGYKFSEAIIYKTVASDLSDLEDVYYDILAFFSPSGINSLFVNFKDFKQNDTRIAVFGPTTAKAARDANLVLDIEAPLPNAPSMTGAIELYIKMANGLA